MPKKFHSDIYKLQPNIKLQRRICLEKHREYKQIYRVQ